MRLWHWEAADKRLTLDAYPSDPRGYFDIDLRDAQVREHYASLGVDVDLAYVASKTPFAVEGRFDDQLCREERSPVEGRRRVVFIGDSFTEGQGVRQSDTFAAILDRGTPELDVLNCGRRGRDFPAMKELFDERLLAFSPDLVVYVMVLNDPERSEAFQAKQAYLDDWILDRRRTVSAPVASPPWWSSRLVTLSREAVEAGRVGRDTERWYHGLFGEENADGWAKTLASIAEMRREAEAVECEFAVVLLPLMVSLDHGYPFDDVSETVAVAMKTAGITFHDATPAFLGRAPRELWVHDTDHHPNEIGHAIIAADLEPLLAGWLAQ